MPDPTRQQFLVTVYGRPLWAGQLAQALKSLIDPRTEGLRVDAVLEPPRFHRAEVGQRIPDDEPAADAAMEGER